MMRPKLLIINALFVLLPLCGRAQDKSLPAFSLEWGYGAGVYEYSHSNYIAEKGFRQDEQESQFRHWSNVFVLAGAGLNAGPHSTFSIITGYSGLTHYRNAVPFLFRYSWYRQGRMAPGFKLSIDAGPAVGVRRSSYAEGMGLAWLGNLGFGYSYPLLDSFRLEFTGLLRCAFDHPVVTDITTGEPVPSSDIRRTNAAHLSLCISIALAF